MHVNSADIRSNSGVYNAKSTASAKEKQADKAALPTDKLDRSAEKSAKTDEFSFWDLVDIVNPLQHIPVVNTIYREITGDQINNIGRIAGGAIFGGFLGAAVGGLNAIAKTETGNDLGEMAMVKAGFRSDAKKEEPIRMVPVVDNKIAAKEERATLDTIIWDAPSLLQVATKETIIWDNPSVATVAVSKPAPKADAKSDIAAAQTAKQADDKEIEAAFAKAADIDVPQHAVRDIPQNAYKMPQFDPAALNAIEPGNVESAVPQPVAATTDNVPSSMMQALSKYQSMQRLGGANAVAAKDFNSQVEVANSGRAAQRSAYMERGIRRY